MSFVSQGGDASAKITYNHVAGPRTWNNLPDAIRDSSLVILNIRKTVEIILVCLTTAAPVIFNWRLTNVLTN